MNSLKYVLTAGFAMFSMFFGSGNLVFPLWLGGQATSQYSYASMGLMITAIIVPFIGLLSMTLYDGDRRKYFKNIGKWPALFLTFAMLCLMGPFGVIPRCIIVGFGGVSLMFPPLSLAAFSAIFCIVIALLIWRPNKIVDVIGRYLSPFLLIGLAVIVTKGILAGPSPVTSSLSKMESFTTGLHKGYQTMDLLAAFFFAATAVAYLKVKVKQTHELPVIKLSLYACLIGAGLLGVVYTGFILIGAKFAPVLVEVAPEKMLVIIAQNTLGDFAVPIAGMTIALACLTTAIILTTLFADFFSEDITKGKVSRPQAIAITLAFSFAMSLLGFMTIAQWIQFALLLAYPALIALAITNICNKVFNWNQGLWPFWGTLFLTVALKYLW